MKSSHSLRPSLALVCALGLSLLVYPLVVGAASLPPDPLRSVWDRTREVGVYHFTADAEQMLIPRPVPGMIGQTDERVDLRIEGDVTLPDRARLRLHLDGAGFGASPVELVQEGTETYLLREGKEIPVENPAGLSSTTSDYLGYLVAAENVRPCEQPVSPPAEGEACYAYDINGPRFAEYVRRQTETRLERSDRTLPPGVELSPAPILQRMTGRGQLWVDADDLPVRQVVDLEMERVNEAYDAQAHVVVDFRFDASAPAQSQASPVGRAGGPTLPPLAGQATARGVAYDVGCLLYLAAIGSVLVVHRRRRWVYALVAGGISLVIVVSPLLQAAGIVRFQARQAHAAAAHDLGEALTLPVASQTSAQVPSTDHPPAERVSLRDARTGGLPSHLPSESPSLAAADPEHVCGDGSVNEDADGDGLSDADEYCLGTDPQSHDSDRDLITDTLEIDGFDAAGRHWVGDPFKPDANGDGLNDVAEWPQPVGAAPELEGVDDWDPDADGVPNLWDEDNDGDEVPDNLDLSPFARTAYSGTFSLSTRGGGFDGYQYIEIQVQPEDISHVGYSAGYLDWPYDDRGQIQDLDQSTEDIRLFPTLRIRTNQAPDQSLARMYDVAVFEEDDGTYSLYAPVTPIGSGGRPVAFHTKVVYGPDDIDEVHWKTVELVWTAQLTHDQEVNGEIETTTTTIATQPEEAFRVTGLKITKSRNYQSAILGTPDHPYDDRWIFNALLGLSNTFLTHQTPELEAGPGQDSIETRFKSPNTPLEMTWGVTSTLVAMNLADEPYGHVDEGLADLTSRVRTFLDSQGYPDDSSPSLVIATEEEIGLYGLDDAGAFEHPPTFSLSLDEVAMTTRRSLRSGAYRYDEDSGSGPSAWRSLDLEETLELLEERYDDEAMADILADLESDYPDLTEDDLRLVLEMIYTAWFIGQTRILRLDGQDLASQSRDDQEVYDRLSHDWESLPAYLLEATHLGEVGGGLRVGDGQTQTWEYQREQEDEGYEMGFLDPEYMLAGRAVIYAGRTVFAANTMRQAVKFAGAVGSFGGRMKVFSDNAGQGARKLGFLATVASVAAIWTGFFVGVADSGWDWDSPAVKQAAIYSAVMTIVSVALFIISLNPVGAILVGLWSFIDLLVFAITGGGAGLTEMFVEAITELIYDVEELTTFEDVEFVDFDTGVMDETIGVVVGNRFRVTDECVGEIWRTSDGTTEDLRDSWVTCAFHGSADGATPVNQNGGRSCTRNGRTLTCRDPVGVEYRFDAAQRDVRLEVASSVEAKTYYEECWLWDCDRESIYTDLPDDLDEDDQWDPITIYLDVLPNDLFQLWTWSDVTNPDPDGDGLSNDEEESLGTLSDAWDTDGDGLSDGFEYESRETLGTDPLDDDSDDDGLTDGLEYRIGTGIDAADSDDDGLLDGEEVFHRDGVDWVGGWMARLPGRGPALVFSNPMAPDADGDGLNDRSERGEWVSPYGFNDSPSLSLKGRPSAESPTGAVATYVAPAEELSVALSLENTGPRAVTSTLTLCLPPFLEGLQGGDMEGDAAPPRELASCNGFEWSFDAPDVLLPGQGVSTTITATVASPMAAASAEITATLPYAVGDTEEEIIDQVAVVVDGDDPEVIITAPSDGMLLGGGVSQYVIGGSSSDESSWVTQVEVELPSEGWVAAEGVSPWAATWDLPSDGTYALRARAEDHVDRLGVTDLISVTVDNTPPTLDLNVEDGAIVSGSTGRVITVTLEGSAADSLSGVTRVQLSTDGRPWREVWAQEGAPANVNWSTSWTLPNQASAQGEHVVKVRAFDRAGNESAVLRRTIVVDVVPPTSELTDRRYLADPPPHVLTDEGLTVYGVANDAGRAPQPSRPVELVGELDGLNDATIWLELSSVTDDDDGLGIAWLGDFNGDRLSDAVVGLPGAAQGAGRIAIVYGRAGGWPTPADAHLLADSPTSLVGEDDAGIGNAIAAAGDVNGDGFADLLVGDGANDSVYLVFGTANSMGRDLVLNGPRYPYWSMLDLTGLQALSYLASAGDVNGDGLDDLLVATAGAEGKAYLLLGEADPWPATIRLEDRAAAEISTDSGGAWLSGAGDMDGDQYDEFVVASSTVVYVFEGSSDYAPGMGAPNETLTLAEDALAQFTSSLTRPEVEALGDVDGDGLADFVYANGDAPTLVLGDADRDWTTRSLAFSPAASGFLAAPGDVDADGLNDLLLGNADGDADLILGHNLSEREATLTGVQVAASAPYAAGSDLNGDGSSDLLLVSAESDVAAEATRYGPLPRVDPDDLPVVRARTGGTFGVRRTFQVAETHTVDDDGGAAFVTIQDALDAAAEGDTIVVEPGVYDSFTVRTDDVTVSGVHADAVFVDGGGGAFCARIEDAVGVTLEHLTLRNAADGIYLDRAGVGGYEDEMKKTRLERVFIHDVTAHAVSIDRVSTLAMARCTLAAGDNHINLYGSPDPTMDAGWSTVSSADGTATTALGGIFSDADEVYFADESGQIDVYDPGTDGWRSLSEAPAGEHAAVAADDAGNLWALRRDPESGFDGPVHAIVRVSETEIYVGGDFRHVGDQPIPYIARWDGAEWHAVVPSQGHPPDDTVHALLVDGGSIYAGGAFGLRYLPAPTQSDPFPAWENWGDIAEDGAVRALALHQGGSPSRGIFVGGDFDDIGGVVAHKIAKREGSGAWHRIGESPNDVCNGTLADVGHVSALLNAGDIVYLAGRFHELGAEAHSSGGCRTPSAYGLAKSNGSAANGYWLSGTPRESDLRKGSDIYAFHHYGSGWIMGGDLDNVRCYYTDGYYSPRGWWPDSSYCTSSGAASNLAIFADEAWQVPGYLKANAPVRAVQVVGDHLYAGGEFTSVGGSTPADHVAYYDRFPDGGGGWHALGGGVNGDVRALVHHEGNTYVGGAFTMVGDEAAFRFARWDGSQWHGLSEQAFYQYDGSSWQRRAVLPDFVGRGASIVSAGDDYLYAVPGSGSRELYRYAIADDAWERRARLPGGLGAGGALAWTGEHIYALAGGESRALYRYDPAEDVWETRASIPDTGPVVGAGGDLVHDGRDWLYVLAGGNGVAFLRYHIQADQWETLENVSGAVNLGGGLVRLGQRLYAVPGGGQELWSYDPVAVYPEKLTLEDVAIVAPEEAVAAEWINLPDLVIWPDDLVVGGAGSAWVGGPALAWTPEPAPDHGVLLSHDDARFLDADRHVYRLDAGSLLDAGYHTYRPDASVGDDEPFSSIQQAIHSGANRVELRPGVYEESFYLISGVQVTGNGADLTIVRPPEGSAPSAVVRAEGVVGAELSMMTLNGAGSGADGLLGEDGLASVVLRRAIIRGASTAINTTGDATALEVVNNTVVSNTNGLVAAGCAPVDARNTVFAHQSGTALSYEPCASKKLHKYNLYWDNGADLSPNDPGPGELFSDPLFVDPGAPSHDYRTEDGSPVIDAGDPGDPTPPGTGERVDIGYVEQNRAAIHVDDDYCATCENDGLSWQVDAFRVIQNALDKADANLRDLKGSQYAVGVAPGVYTETLVVPSHVRLIGSGAEESTVAADTGQAAVTFDGVVGSEIAGFTVEARPDTTAISVTNASNAITVTRNVIETNNAGSYAAVAFTDRATGLVTFNTLVDLHHGGDDTGILSSGPGTWVAVENNLLSGPYRMESGSYNECDYLFYDGHVYGLRTRSSGQIFNAYNLFHVRHAYQDDANTGLTAGPGDFRAQPCLERDTYRLQPPASARDAGSPYAEVPPGGGQRADIGYHELTAAPLAIFLGREDRSAAVGNSGMQELEVGFSSVADPGSGVTETLPGAWTSVPLDAPEETLSYWQTGFTPTQESLYRIYSRATDVAGNPETADAYREDLYAGAFVADGVSPVVTWTLPSSGAAVPSPLELRAEVSDYAAGAFSVEDVSFEVDGHTYEAEWAADPWEEENEEPRTFRAWVDLSSGPHTAVAVARDRAGNAAESSLVTFSVSGSAGADNGMPFLTIVSPYDGEFFAGTVVFSGTVADAESGVAAVEVSLDGGYTWRPATVDGADWTLTWDPPEDRAFVSYPARVRARDQAGNDVEQAVTFSIDNVPPAGPDVEGFTAIVGPFEKEAPPGTHFDVPVALRIAWRPPVDGSGYADSLVAVNQMTDTVPGGMTNLHGDTVYTATLGAPGDWYVHLAVQDGVGNRFTRHFGPWHVGTFADVETLFRDRLQTILVDGEMGQSDLESILNEQASELREIGREWGVYDFMDDFRRSGPNESWWNPQRLFATWDGLDLYLGWSGAWWTLDGEMWAYLDTGTGGCTGPVRSLPGCQALPFAADRAISVSGPTDGTFWTCLGGAWAEDTGADWSFAQGESGDTEIAINWLDLVSASAWPPVAEPLHLGLIAYAVDDAGEPWAVFPTTNPMTDVCSDSYSWSNLYDPLQPYSVTLPSDGQPVGTDVLMTLDSSSSPLSPVCPGAPLDYVLELRNREVYTAPALTVNLDVGPALSYVDVTGAVGLGPWSFEVPEIPPGAGHTVTVTAALGDEADVCGVAETTAITVAAELLAEPPIRFDLTHLVDCLPPTLTVATDPAQTLRPVLGTASDSGGTGVSRVEYRMNDGAWQPASGTLFWSADVELPGTSAWQVDVRAWDQCRVGEVTTLTFDDSTAPTLTVDVDPVVNIGPVTLHGTARDLPDGGDVVAAEVAVDGVWRSATLDPPDGENVRQWHTAWEPPTSEMTYTVQARGVDAAGNTGHSEPMDVYVRTPLSTDAVTITVTPEEGGTLIYTDTQGLTTTVQVPPAAVSRTLTLVFTPLDEPTHPTAPLIFAGHAFTLDLYRGPYRLHGCGFQEPVSVVIAYSEADVAGIAREATLTLETWSGLGWEDGACLPYQRQLDVRRLSTGICCLGEFALLGEASRGPVVGGVTVAASHAIAPWRRVLVATALLGAVLAVAAARARRRREDGGP